MAAIDPGDEVIVLEPWYPQHNSKIELVGGRVVTVSMRRVNGAYRLDPERLEAAITPRTSMVVLINPTNPTGTVYSAAELAALAQICIRHDLLVLSDEVYEYITFDGHRHISIATLPGMRERTITVSAFTKAYAMDGWRQGYVMATAPIIADLRKVTMNDTTHPCVFAQEGALAAVVGPQQCLAEMVERDRARRDLAVSRLNAMPGSVAPCRRRRSTRSRTSARSASDRMTWRWRSSSRRTWQWNPARSTAPPAKVICAYALRPRLTSVSPKV